MVSRALKLILDGGLEADNVEALATRLGIGPRHLRRLFVQHLGVSTHKIDQTRRVHLARTLLEDTPLSITDVAFQSGFRSIRQFNDAIHAAFDSPPSKLRRLHQSTKPDARDGGIVLHLRYRPPFDWQALIAFLQSRTIPGVEAIDEDVYQRTIAVDGDVGAIEVRPDDNQARLGVKVKLKRYVSLARVVDRVRRMFDLFADPGQISEHLSNDPQLRKLVHARPGLRIPGAWDGFELAVRAILGESLIAPGAKDPVAKLVRTFGQPAVFAGGLTHLFPSPQVLADADLSLAGIRGKNAIAIRAVANAVSTKHLAFEGPDSFDEVVSRLRGICGMDKAKAHYVAMRAFGEPDAFPLAGSDEPLTLAEGWRPWRSYAAMHLEAQRHTAFAHTKRE